jgi:hypothetical protein
MSNTAEPRGKKESPTENRRTFTRKGGAKTGNFVVKTPNFVRKER